MIERDPIGRDGELDNSVHDHPCMPVIHASHPCQSSMPVIHGIHPYQSSMPVMTPSMIVHDSPL